ncbi:hypothetical protein [Coleofasciculus sp.]|uniref:hypothetical protein n=1 Tax=Coleofasciculus sp. TaxID=3100458 RepID=UPI0039FB409B
MTVQLSQPDFLQLTRIVQNLPDFANVRDRTDLVAEALANVPQVNSIWARLDLDGSPMVASVEVASFLFLS